MRSQPNYHTSGSTPWTPHAKDHIGTKGSKLSVSFDHPEQSHEANTLLFCREQKCVASSKEDAIFDAYSSIPTEAIMRLPVVGKISC